MPFAPTPPATPRGSIPFTPTPPRPPRQDLVACTHAENHSGDVLRKLGALLKSAEQAASKLHGASEQQKRSAQRGKAALQTLADAVERKSQEVRGDRTTCIVPLCAHINHRRTQIVQVRRKFCAREEASGEELLCSQVLMDCKHEQALEDRMAMKSDNRMLRGQLAQSQRRTGELEAERDSLRLAHVTTQSVRAA